MVKKISYKQLQAELDEVLTSLQSSELDIEKSLELYKRGQIIIKQLEDFLKNTKNEIEHLKKS